MKYVIALDIGGTKIEGVLFDSKLKKIKSMKVYFKKKKSEAVVRMPKKEVLELICSIISNLKRGKDITGIGISIPDVITKEGSISGTSKIKALSNFPIAKYIEKKFRCKTRAANDADCFALAEQRLGATLRTR